MIEDPFYGKHNQGLWLWENLLTKIKHGKFGCFYNLIYVNTTLKLELYVRNLITRVEINEMRMRTFVTHDFRLEVYGLLRLKDGYLPSVGGEYVERNN